MYKTKLNRIQNLIEKIKNDITLPLISDFLDWFLEKLDIHFNKNTPSLKLNKWEIYFVKLGQNIWWELNKERPCIIYSDKKYNWWNTVLIIPLKSYKGKINNYFNTFIKSENNELKKDSIADLWAIRQISKKRILTKAWKINEKDLEKIDKKLIKILWIKNREK